MQITMYDWLGHEWVSLRAEGRGELDVAEQTKDIFGRFDAELGRMGLSLSDAMRSRLWARDRASRDQGSRVRVATLAGASRSVSSSFIAPEYFDSEAAVAVELWAMRPADSGTKKTLVEYDPPIAPLRYLIRESVLALSGVTSVLPALKEQVSEILAAIERSLAHAGAGWSRAVKISCLLHRNQSLTELRSLLAPVTAGTAANIEYGFADGYSTEGKLIEIEVTAQIAR
jgi:enamine deaminase RidA (YjgF/YER057c/UK114 family)